MILDYQTHGKVKIDMTEYLLKILKYVPKKHKGNAVMPAANHLFEVKNNGMKSQQRRHTDLQHRIVQAPVY